MFLSKKIKIKNNKRFKNNIKYELLIKLNKKIK